LDEHADRVAQPVHPSPAAAGKGGAGVVQLEVVAGHPPCGEIALEDVAEADEEARRDRARDLTLPGLVPAALEEPGFEEPREADVFGSVLDLGGLPLAPGGVLGEVAEVLGKRIVARTELP